MRTFKYTEEDLNFLTELLFYDVRSGVINRRNGGDVGDKVWYKLMGELACDFRLSESEKWLIIRKVANKYEEDSELVNPRDRYDRRGLPFDRNVFKLG